MCEYDLVLISDIKCGDTVRYSDYHNSYYTKEYHGVVAGMHPTEKKFMFRTTYGVKLLIVNEKNFNSLETIVLNPKRSIWKKNNEA